MAGRRTSARVLAMTIAVMATAGAAPSNAAPSTDGAIVVSQTGVTASVPFGRRFDSDTTQKIAQTFVAPKEAHKLATLSLALAGDKKAIVKILEVGEKPPTGTVVRTITVPVDHMWGDEDSPWIDIRVRPALVVQPGHRYSFVLAAKRRRHSFAAAGGSGYRGGQFWCYCPTEKDGELDYEDRQWQTDAWKTDLAFHLRFWRKG